jgi:hypothetical protein
MAQPYVRVRIDGLKLIARYLKLSTRQLRKCYAITVPQNLRCPVFKLPGLGSRNKKLFAWQDELDAWQDRMSTRDLWEAESR